VAGLDFGEVYPPVVSTTTVRVLLAVVAAFDYELDQLDVATAFLNAPLSEDVYMRPPPGLSTPPDSVLKLKKSLYGLRQAPREWNTMLQSWLLSNGFQQSSVDRCLFFIPGVIWVVVWVDDFAVMAKEKAVSAKFKQDISNRFAVHDLGPLRHFLGLEVVRDRENRSLSLFATSHIDEALARFNLSDASPVYTPLPSGIHLVPCPSESERAPSTCPYRALLGTLLYIASWARPDISFAVSQLAKFQERPSMQHWTLAKHALRYLKHTRSLGITYSGRATASSVSFSNNTGVPSHVVDPSGKTLFGMADASWADDIATRRSHSGHVFLFANAAVAWHSKQQDLVTLSSTEAEYVALGSAVREALFLRSLFSVLLDHPLSTVPILEDNQSTIRQASNLQSTSRSKHLDIRHHFLKDHVQQGDVQLYYVPTSLQAADSLTKSLDRVKVSLFRQIVLGG